MQYVLPCSTDNGLSQKTWNHSSQSFPNYPQTFKNTSSLQIVLGKASFFILFVTVSISQKKYLQDEMNGSVSWTSSLSGHNIGVPLTVNNQREVPLDRVVILKCWVGLTTSFCDAGLNWRIPQRAVVTSICLFRVVHDSQELWMTIVFRVVRWLGFCAFAAADVDVRMYSLGCFLVPLVHK